jgi:hypothetical protein
MPIPFDPSLSISKLAAVFNNTSATYKFYWFWAIIEAVESGERKIEKKDLFAKMLTLSWYTVNYFYISFGKQDAIQDAVREIKEIENIKIDIQSKKLHDQIRRSPNHQTSSILRHFDNNVPHKFLSPWLGSGSRKSIYENSANPKFNAPYILEKEFISIDENWFEYIRAHSGILKTFCYWNLTLFLQKRNPNVPDIANKIQRPLLRSGLSDQKKKYWDLIIDELGSLNCIYTGVALQKGSYDIDHFVPYQFVAHDSMWNLIPAERTFNRQKGSKLPYFDDFFEAFFEIQRTGFEIIKDNKPKSRYLEDYLFLFPELEMNKDKFAAHVKTTLSLAHNNGFEYLNKS